MADIAPTALPPGPTLGQDVIKYKPSPTLAAFHADNIHLYRGVMGPFGSGKSTAMVMEILFRATNQAPYKNVRRTKWVVVRNTYPDLINTTIATWKQWMPEKRYPMRMTAPITAYVKFTLPDKTLVDCEVVFVSMDRPEDASKVLGLEVTGAWMNEFRELPKAAVDAMGGRVGRFPPMREGGPTWFGVIMDTNPPDNDSEYYKLFEEEKPEGWILYKQPGGIRYNSATKTYSPRADAENIGNLPGGHLYYINQLGGKDREWIKVHLEGEYGAVFTGKAVYADHYLDSVHVAPSDLGYFKGIPLLFGWDFGLTPALVIAQMLPNGSLWILDELLCENGGIHQFVASAVLPLLNRKYRGVPFHAWGDPAGTTRSQHNSTHTCYTELESLGLPALPASSNDFALRREAVMYFLQRMQQGRPAFLISPTCKLLRKGFQGGYQFARVQVRGEERYHDEPVKNLYSHLHDALQYLCMGARGPVKRAGGHKHAPPQRSTWDAFR